MDAAPTSSWTPSTEIVRRLERGELYAEVLPGPRSATGRIRSAVDIRAPADQVWQLILSCGDAKTMLPAVEACRIASRDTAGTWDVREHKVRWARFMPTMTTRFRSEYTWPSSIRFRCVGGTLRHCEGEWQLVPIHAGKATRLIYTNDAEGPAAAPAELFRTILKRQIPVALSGLRRLSEARQP